MSKDIKEFIHYYLGQQFMMTKPAYHAVHEFGLSSDTPFAMSGKFADYFHGDAVSAEVKPILRKLESLQHDEIVELFRLRDWLQPETISRTGNENGFIQIEGTKHEEYFSDYQDLKTIYPAQFHYLLSRGFDLFNLIPEGLAIDKETLK